MCQFGQAASTWHYVHRGPGSVNLKVAVATVADHQPTLVILTTNIVSVLF
jgi:hypothetical protein